MTGVQTCALPILLTGIWHGANWNFICWGLYYFVLLAAEKLFLLPYLKKGRVWPHFYTLFLVVVGWAMFVGNDTGVSFGLLFQKLFVPSGGVSPLYFLRNYGVLLAVSVVCCTPLIEKLWDVLRKNVVTRCAAILTLLVSEGVKEFQVIAQELTYYGVDLYKKQMLPELIEQMAHIPGVEWIRLHYAYPAHFPEDLFRVMRENDNVCKYMDIALQHISDNMLQKMRRHVTKEETYQLIEKFRKEVPGIHLRTTLMVGHPGETEQDFEELMEFVRTARFDRMGAFAYSEEEGTYSAKHYKDEIPQEVKQQRLDKLMELQQEISADLSHRKIGQEFKVIIDRKEGDYYIGRTQFDSPEVDPEVLIKVENHRLRIGSFHRVKVYDADDFDLYATIVK